MGLTLILLRVIAKESSQMELNALRLISRVLICISLLCCLYLPLRSTYFFTWCKSLTYCKFLLHLNFVISELIGNFFSSIDATCGYTHELLIVVRRNAATAIRWGPSIIMVKKEKKKKKSMEAPSIVEYQPSLLDTL